MTNPDQKIRFFFKEVRFHFSNRKRLKTFLQWLLIKEGRNPKAVNYIFCTNPMLRKLNKKYLKHDYNTDILTFDLSSSQNELLAEIFISIPRVKENSKLFESSFSKELHRVMIHGILHLCGYGDKTSKQIREMRRMEDKYLLAYNRFM